MTRTFTKKELLLFGTAIGLIALLLGGLLFHFGSKVISAYSLEKAEYGYTACVQDVVTGIDTYGYIQVPNGDSTVVLVPLTQEEEGVVETDNAE